MIGALRRRLVLETAVRVADGFGGFTLSWTPVADVWAEVTAQSGAETLEGDRLNAVRRSTVTVRHLGELMPAMRFTGLGRVYEIVSVRDPEGRDRMLVCDCLETELG